jgi:aspartate/methionine/tyrosine aminotransferase
MACELSEIPNVRFAMPHGGFYFFADVSAYGSALETARRILERANVITIPGPAFGSGGEGYLRLSFAASEQDIVRGMRRIRRELTGR